MSRSILRFPYLTSKMMICPTIYSSIMLLHVCLHDIMELYYLEKKKTYMNSKVAVRRLKEGFYIFSLPLWREETHLAAGHADFYLYSTEKEAFHYLAGSWRL